MNATITLREYLEKEKCFVVPNYQRGYVWGKAKQGKGKDAVTYILDSLIQGFNDNVEVFIQGVTVSETDKDIILIDGQQRTTFFYLLLKYIGYTETFHIKYDIRNESNNFLTDETLLVNIQEDINEKYQDIYFFKKTLRIIEGKLRDVSDIGSFRSYVLNNVKFLYIVIPIEKATRVFSMMNGNKAEMKSEELIKAELLRLASLTDKSTSDIGEKEFYAIEWDNNMLRSRYAREWDKWLQWWNKPNVKSFYKVNSIMGLLTSTHYQLSQSAQFTFESFKNAFLSKQQSIEAKITFDHLRRLQKRFEDAFNNPQIYTRIGSIIRISNKEAFVKWYFIEQKPSFEDLDRYYKLTFLGLSHKDILADDNEDIIKQQYGNLLQKLGSNDLYNQNPEEAFRLLLRMNIDEDNKQEDGRGRKFDFSIWDRNDSRGRSLEHIYPKSKVWHIEQIDEREVVKNGKGDEVSPSVKEDPSYIARNSCCCDNDDYKASEHSIGNLVLLYKDDNSSFNNSSFQEKKVLFFKTPTDKKDKKTKAIFKSRHLLHTIYKFANSEWKGKNIAENKRLTLNQFKEYYGKR